MMDWNIEARVLDESKTIDDVLPNDVSGEKDDPHQLTISYIIKREMKNMRRWTDAQTLSVIYRRAVQIGASRFFREYAGRAEEFADTLVQAEQFDTPVALLIENINFSVKLGTEDKARINFRPLEWTVWYAERVANNLKTTKASALRLFLYLGLETSEEIGDRARKNIEYSVSDTLSKVSSLSELATVWTDLNEGRIERVEKD